MSGLEGLLAGRTLVKRYRIEEVIGRGGFAAVYRAADENLGRTVAVKVITLAAPDPDTREQLRERFQREARAAASLPHHPNVVAVHDFGTDPALQLDFLVMEYLEGEDLSTRLRLRGRPPLEEALCILREAAQGLAVGHRAGLIHRDVKPGNIFLAASLAGDPFRVCILDFGIARVATEENHLTHTGGSGPLSPAYASPEQLRGERELTPAADVFGLGVVGYQLLTGEQPFGAERTLDPAASRPARGVREINPEVPAPIAAIVERALAYAPEDRFPDAGAFESALEAALPPADVTRIVPAPLVSHEPPPAAPLEEQTLLHPGPVVAARPAPPRSRQRKRSFPTALVALLLLAGVAVAGWLVVGRGEDIDAGSEQVGGPAEPEPAVAADETTRAAGSEGGAETAREPEPRAGRRVRGAERRAPATPARLDARTAPVQPAAGAPVDTMLRPPVPAATRPTPATEPQPAPQPASVPGDPRRQAEPAAPQPDSAQPQPPEPEPPPRVLGVPVQPNKPAARPDSAAVSVPDAG